MACVARKIEPSRQDAEQFRWHHGDFDTARKYFILEFPVPPTVDLSGLSPEQIVSDQRVVLAPHFAAVLLPKSGGPADYYILGQAPLGWRHPPSAPSLPTASTPTSAQVPHPISKPLFNACAASD